MGQTACFAYSPDFGANGAAFVLSIHTDSTTKNVTTHTTIGNTIVPVLGTAEAVKLYYNTSTLQLQSLMIGLCIDDGGHEALGGQNYSAAITFQPCDPQSSNQQFILNSQHQILNPNWPNNNICFNGNGTQNGGLNQLILWECTPGDSVETFYISTLNCQSKLILRANELKAQLA